MKRFADFISSGYLPAIVSTVVFAWSTILFPFGSILSASSLSLFGLRRGTRAAVVVFLVSCVSLLVLTILVSAIGLLTANPWDMLLLFGLVLWLPSLLGTHLIRRSNSLSFLFQVATIFSMAIIFLAAILFPERNEFWSTVFNWMTADNVETLLQQRPDLVEPYESVLMIMTGISISSLLLIWIPSLLLSYWWGSLLLEPGGFKKIFVRLQLGKTITLVATFSVLLAALFSSSVAWELMIVLMTIYLFQGIATIHDILARKGASFLLFFFYAILVISPLLPILPMGIAGLGFLENFINIRKRIKT